MYNNIVILTGAGISAESGISTFRDSGGLWANYRVEDVATPEGFDRNPDLVHNFYNKRRSELASVRPNEAHIALVALELNIKGSVLVVTQNVDDLHERAGSQNLLHMHGELLKVRCERCGEVIRTHESFNKDSVCQSCKRSGGLRPDIVWFGELPKYMDEISFALAGCDLFISIGTSGAVYPAAGFVQVARGAGAHTVELNLERSEGASLFHERIYGKATEVVPKYVKELLM
ncbi:MAG: NAD-dependent protein deacylase [Deferribacteraceae bacterium]|jgi:NAD-dependent deacetylase|nr:NAD-dependent protein deacylase [Deferribacteraceae bacterium]